MRGVADPRNGHLSMLDWEAPFIKLHVQKILSRFFNKAGHILSYDQILQVDTSLAESTLKSLDPETGSVMPPNVLPGKFVHFVADNIDILDEKLDGENTFHDTEIAAWQKGAESNII